MTKTKKKNIFLGAGVTSIFAAAFGASAAIYFSAGELENVANKGDYIIRSNTPLNLGGYYFDSTASYGTASSKSSQNLMNANAIRIQTIGETKFNTNALTKNIVVAIPSKSKLVLELAKELVLVFVNNSTNEEHQVIFNSDEAEIEPLFSSKTLIPETVALKSNNPKSINSNYFNELLAGSANMNENGELVPVQNGQYSIRSLGFTVKENVPWIDSDGNKTKYNINVNDFYYSYMRTWLFDAKFRRSHGGTESLDTYFINSTATNTRFKNDDKYPNDYLFGLFGIDSKSMQDENKTIVPVTIDNVSTNMFVISASPEEKHPKFRELLTKIFLDSNLIPAAPSEFINELVEKNQYTKYDGEEITGLAKKFGIYIYGNKRVDNLFASAYIPVSSADNRIVFIKNENFANKDFVEEKTTMKRIIFQFSTSPTYNDQLFTNYLEKTVSEITYQILNEKQKIKIFGTSVSEKEALNSGLLQVKQLNKSKLVQRTLLTTDPKKLTKDKDGNWEQYYFNEEYAKIMYGSTIESLREGVGKTTESFFYGSGFELRTLLNSSINWYTFINNSWKGERNVWLNNTAQNAKYNSLSNSDMTPLDYVDTINNINYFNDGEKKVINQEQMKKQFIDNVDNANNQYKSTTEDFALIKKLVKSLLDKNNVTINNPLKWAIAYPWSDAPSQVVKINQLEKIIETINSLDSRLQPYLFIPSSNNELLDSIARNKGISDFNGWGYDYEGIGSFIDGISHGQGISLLGAFSMYSCDDEKYKNIKVAFPEFTKLSLAIKENFKYLPAGKKVEDWINLTNDNNNNIDYHFVDVSPSYNISTEFAKFFLDYQTLITDQEITDLIIELNSIAGFSMNSDNSIDNPDKASLSLVLLEYYYPTTESGILYLSDIRNGDKSD